MLVFSFLKPDLHCMFNFLLLLLIVWTNYRLLHFLSVHFGLLVRLDGQICLPRILRGSIQLQCLKLGMWLLACFFFVFIIVNNFSLWLQKYEFVLILVFVSKSFFSLKSLYIKYCSYIKCSLYILFRKMLMSVFRALVKKTNIAMLCWKMLYSTF